MTSYKRLSGSRENARARAWPLRILHNDNVLSIARAPSLPECKTSKKARALIWPAFLGQRSKRKKKVSIHSTSVNGVLNQRFKTLILSRKLSINAPIHRRNICNFWKSLSRSAVCSFATIVKEGFGSNSVDNWLMYPQKLSSLTFCYFLCVHFSSFSCNLIFISPQFGREG